MHLLQPSLLLPCQSISVSTLPSPGVFSLFKHLSTYHSSTKKQWRAWSQCTGGQIACTTGMEGSVEEKDWEGRNGRYSRMERMTKDRPPLFTFSTFFLFFLHCLSIDFIFNPTIQYVYPCFLPPTLPCTQSSSIKLTLPLIPCELWI